ncbi:MAG: preprotein translocase subunit SecG [Bacteroidetes bacterium CG2_30_33_31]|nr:MAG: preprotein translocase subunit SecG [Bacteroidetes bacterium CG2_30_33_31]
MGIYYMISILIFIVCILLILVVLVQNSKGGGLTSTFAASNQVLGVKKTADFLEKTTWTLAISLLLLTLSTIFVIPRSENTSASENTTLQYLQENETAKPINYNPAVNPQAEKPQEAPAKENEGQQIPK